MCRSWLWVDDERPPPDPNWEWVSNYDWAVERLLAGGITKISLDHDLGENSKTGYQLATWIESRLRTDEYFQAPMILLSHSANPPGAANIRRAFDAIRRFDYWAYWESERAHKVASLNVGEGDR
jgi:hypothetical protein